MHVLLAYSLQPNPSAMRSELVVDVSPNNISTALLEDGRLVTLQQETRDASYAVGNLYIAKVKKLMPGLNAAFVNVGYDKDAFLHYLDLGSQFTSYAQYIKSVRENKGQLPKSISELKLQPDMDKHGTVSDVLSQGMELIVQVAKNPFLLRGHDSLLIYVLPVDFWFSLLLITRFLYLKKLRMVLRKPD